MSPLKNVDELGVPPAERSAVTVTAPAVAELGVKSINVPSVVFTVVTPTFTVPLEADIVPELVIGVLPIVK